MGRAVDSAVGSNGPHADGLRRRLNLPLLVLYGLGVTIGAGIYVLIGLAAERAGSHAPLAFLLAGLVMAFAAASFAELCVRFPVSAGEAAYVAAAFRSPALSTAVGLGVAGVGLVSAATVALGGAGYLRSFIALPAEVLVPVVVVAMGAIAALGILQSVAIAAVMTLLEVGRARPDPAAGALRNARCRTVGHRGRHPRAGRRRRLERYCGGLVSWPCSPSSASRTW